jgi:thiosulfate/3-mercaptopyruvate sulfurtransferase
MSHTISTEALAAILGNDNVRVLDCSVSMGRQPGDDYRVGFLKSHIKGAQLLDLDNLKDQRSDLPFMMPNENQFIDAMKRLNVKMTDHVVCYDTGAMQFFGYRAAWMFQAMGHPNVCVLDGGFPKWTKEGRAVEATDAGANAGAFGYKLDANKIKLLDHMKAFAGNEAERNYQLLDVRAPD